MIAQFPAIAFVTLLLASCTSVGQVTPAVLAFAETTSQVQSGFSTRQRAVDALLEERVLSMAAAAVPNAVRRDGCSTADDHCRLYLVRASGDPLSITPQADHVSRLMDELAAYAADLSALARADTGTEFAKATADTAKSIASFASTVDDLAAQSGAGALVAAASGPVAEIVTIVGRRILERQKLVALRKAVGAMEAELDGAVAVLARFESSGARLEVQAAASDFENAYFAYQTGAAGRANLVKLRKAAIALDAGLRVSGADSFRKLRDAHRQLAHDLNRPASGFDELWPLLESAAADAARLERAASQLRDLRS